MGTGTRLKSTAPVTLAVEQRVGIGPRSVRRIRNLFATPIRTACLPRLVVIILRWRRHLLRHVLLPSRPLEQILIQWQWRGDRLDAAHRRIRPHLRPVDRHVPPTHQPGLDTGLDRLLENLPPHLLLPALVAQLHQRGAVRHRVGGLQQAEPPVPQVHRHLVAQPHLGEPEQVPHQHHSDDHLRVPRWASLLP
jgi:hypothetical protein